MSKDAPKQFNVRKGYFWIGKDGKQTGQTVISEADPMFRSQIHKLDPIPVGEKEADPRVASSYEKKGDRLVLKADRFAARASESVEEEGKSGKKS